MPITYINAKEKTYYLLQGTTKTGKPRYYFSPKCEGTLVDSLPVGYEIYETPNAQVFLRRIVPQRIRDEEKQIVAAGMAKFTEVQHYKVDVKGKFITIYTASQETGFLDPLFRDFQVPMYKRAKVIEEMNRRLHYSPVMQFELIDEDKRLFTTQRYCFRGAVEDWLSIGKSGELQLLVRRHVKHIDKESFFGLL